MRHRLYHRVFHTLLAFVLLALALAALAGHLLLSEVFQTHLGDHLAARASALARELPPAGRPEAELQAALERVSVANHVHAAIFGPDGRRLAFTSADVPVPPAHGAHPGLLASRGGPSLVVSLAEGRRLVLQPRRIPRPGGFLVSVLALAAVLALASYPVARLVTRRLEALEAGVRRLGEGDLTARVEIKGDDELASLARVFNQAAERLQRLIEAQRRVLASASHELRSPLARLRMALALAGEDPDQARSRLEGAVAEVEELDSLVEELLLAGRLELQAPAAASEAVEVGGLLAAEAARTGATVAIEASPLAADPRLLRVLLRNLLENGRRHGRPSAVEAGVAPLAGEPSGVRIWVADRGPGVPEAERERIFEPFYRPSGHAEERDGGVGLGLYLVRRIAEAYGGTATCRAREGGGTIFEVILHQPPPGLPPHQGPSAM